MPIQHKKWISKARSISHIFLIIIIFITFLLSIYWFKKKIIGVYYCYDTENWVKLFNKIRIVIIIMKVNERTLVQVVNSSQAPIDRCGWLFKRGEVNRSFQKRWCVLKGNLFYYFDKKTDREPIGVILLEGCRIELAENETELFAFKIEFGWNSSNSFRTYVLGSESQQDMEGYYIWLAISYDDYY